MTHQKRISAPAANDHYLSRLDRHLNVIYFWRHEKQSTVKVGKTSVGAGRWKAGRPTDVSPESWEQVVSEAGRQLHLCAVPVAADQLDAAELTAHELLSGSRSGTSEFFTISDAEALRTADKLAAIYNSFVEIDEHLNRFEKDLIAELESTTALSREVRTLYPEKLEQADKIWDGLQNSPNGRGVAAVTCGFGKSPIAADLVSRTFAEGAKLVVVAAPTLALIDQLIKEFSYFMHAGELPRFHAVSSLAAPTIAQFVSVEHSTSATDVRDAIEADGPLLIFTTYDSCHAVRDGIMQAAVRDGVKPSDVAGPSLVVLDEAHNLCVNSADLQVALTMPKHRQLAMTATMMVAGEDTPDNIPVMDDEELFGPVISRVTYFEALQMGSVPRDDIGGGTRQIVTDIDLVIPVVETGLDEKSLNAEFNGRTVSSHIAVAAIAACHNEYDLRSTITKHNSIEHAEGFRGLLEEHAELFDRNLIANSVSSKSGERHRRQVIAEIDKRDESTRIVSQCLIFSEGLNAPGIDAWSYVDRTSSIKAVVQNVGRATRPDPRNPNKVAVLNLAGAPVNSSRDSWDLVIHCIEAMVENGMPVEEVLARIKPISNFADGAEFIAGSRQSLTEAQVATIMDAISLKVLARSGASAEELWADLVPRVERFFEASGRPPAVDADDDAERHLAKTVLNVRRALDTGDGRIDINVDGRPDA